VISVGGVPGVIAVRRQERQVVDQDHPAGRRAVMQLAPDRREVLAKPLEALVRRAGVPKLGDVRPDGRKHRQRPRQARQREPGRKPDVVAARGDGDEGGVAGHRVKLSRPAAAALRMSLVVAPVALRHDSSLAR